MGLDDLCGPSRSRPLDLDAIAVRGVLDSGFLGATTNAVNGLLSPRYFVTILGWNEVTIESQESNVYLEPSTGGRGVHGYVLIDKRGFGDERVHGLGKMLDRTLKVVHRL